MMENLLKETRDVKLRINSLLSKKSNHECLIPTCKRKSIGSHSISKNTLQLIEHDNHVVSQQFNRAKFNKKSLTGKEINLSFKPIGLDKATKFKGFCKIHDNDIFLNIDNRGIITQRDIFLQIYRTASKFFFIEREINKAEKEIYGFEYSSNTEYDNNQVVNLEKVIFLIDDLLRDFPDLDATISLKNSDTMILKPFSKKINLEVEVIYKKIDKIIPVAFQKNFQLSMDDEHHISLATVIPSQTHTNLIVLCHPKITQQYRRMMNSNIQLLNLVESILMHDSDFYLSPKIYDSWDNKRRTHIIQDFYFMNERSFLEEYDLSLFDEIRKEICMTLPEKERVHELKKIYELPTRDSIEARNNRLLAVSIRDRQRKVIVTGNTTSASYPVGGFRVE